MISVFCYCCVILILNLTAASWLLRGNSYQHFAENWFCGLIMSFFFWYHSIKSVMYPSHRHSVDVINLSKHIRTHSFVSRTNICCSRNRFICSLCVWNSCYYEDMNANEEKQPLKSFKSHRWWKDRPEDWSDPFSSLTSRLLISWRILLNVCHKSHLTHELWSNSGIYHKLTLFGMD